VNTFTISLCLFSQVLLVGGNLILKHAMNGTNDAKADRFRIGLWLGAGIVVLAAWFFIWLELLGKQDLSQLYAFEGLAPVLLMVSAWLFLGEKVSLRGWAGVALIGVGLTLVAAA
jgi:drug/metabolite transporter (DMT)-like permease